MSRQLLWHYAGVILLGTAATLRAEIIALHPMADTTLIQVAPGNNLGGADFFNAGTAGNGNRNRALLSFDLSGIPIGSTINFASLSFDIIRQPVMDLQTATFGLHRMLVSWNEGVQIPEDENSPGLGAPAAGGESAWAYRFAIDTGWSVPGGQPGVEFVAAPSSTTFVYGLGDPVLFESTAEIAADVQFWLDNPNQNFGWMFMTETEQVRKSARSFASREDPNGGPLLLIDFTPVPEPGSVALFASGLVLFWCSVRLRKGHKIP
jgi:PEP-CTERM motif